MDIKCYSFAIGALVGAVLNLCKVLFLVVLIRISIAVINTMTKKGLRGRLVGSQFTVQHPGKTRQELQGAQNSTAHSAALRTVWRRPPGRAFSVPAGLLGSPPACV